MEAFHMHQTHLTYIRLLSRRARHRPWALAIRQVMATLPGIGRKKSLLDLATEVHRVQSFAARTNCELA